MLIASSLFCFGQNAPPLSFEAASVKPTSGLGAFSGGPGSSDPGRVTYGGATLVTLIRNAYDLKLGQVSGPDWLNTEYYALTATLPPGTTQDQFRGMLANLLSERFGLVFHRVTKEVTGYELVVAPGGSKMTRSATETVVSAAPDDARPGNDKNGSPVQPPYIPWVARRDGDVLRLTFRQIPMAGLANALSLIASARGSSAFVRIEDRTELTGKFDGDVAIDIDGDPLSGVPVADISKALKKQAGLELNQKKMSVEMLVVDHAERVPRPD